MHNRVGTDAEQEGVPRGHGIGRHVRLRLGAERGPRLNPDGHSYARARRVVGDTPVARAPGTAEIRVKIGHSLFGQAKS